MTLNQLKPYIFLTRLDKPIGIVLLLFPCWWGVVYVQKSQFLLSLLLLFLSGALIMRSAGCILNDLFDAKFDRQVARTKNRPLACGTVQRGPALVLFCLLCLAGLGVLLQLPVPCWGLGIVGLLLLFIYPLMKRLTDFPQVWLGFAFNIGFLIGIVAVTGNLKSLLSWPVACIYGAAILWTVGYDTIYAVQDRDDDQRLGVRSTAVLFGKRTKLITLGIYGLSALLLITAVLLSTFSMGAILLIGAVYGYISMKLRGLNLENGEECRDFFIANQWIGAVVFLALMI